MHYNVRCPALAPEILPFNPFTLSKITTSFYWTPPHPQPIPAVHAVLCLLLWGFTHQVQRELLCVGWTFCWHRIPCI